jgi:hypothetical protein
LRSQLIVPRVGFVGPEVDQVVYRLGPSTGELSP